LVDHRRTATRALIGGEPRASALTLIDVFGRLRVGRGEALSRLPVSRTLNGTRIALTRGFAARVHRHENHAYRDVGDREPGRASRKGASDVHGHRDHGQHAAEHQDALENVVGIEAIGVDPVSHPRDAHRGEEQEKAQHAHGGGVVGEELGQLVHHDDKDEVEEQLERPGAALGARILGRSQPRWLDPAATGEDGGGRRAVDFV
jgi:hypothetical protein